MTKIQMMTHKYRRKIRQAKALSLSASSVRKAKPFPMPMCRASDLPRGFRAKTQKYKSRQNAEPLIAPVRRAAQEPGSVVESAGDSGFQTRITEKVSDFNEHPYSAIGKMFFVDENNDTFVGSCWIVGRNSFVTAAHCLFDRDESEDFYDNITITPAFNGLAGAELIPVVSSAIHPNYAEKPTPDNLRWDIGVGIVETDLIEEFGSLGYDASGEVDEEEIEAIGYPAASRPIPAIENAGQNDFETHAFNGKKMWHSIGDHLGSAGDLHGMKNEMTGGCSGGPWVIDENVGIGLNSHRLVPHDNRMFSPILDEDFLLLIEWLIENDAFLV